MEEGGLSLDGVSKDYCFRNWRFSERASEMQSKSILEESQHPQFVYNMKVMEIEKRANNKGNLVYEDCTVQCL